MGCHMSLTLHLGKVSDKHGAKFNPQIANMEKRYSGKWSKNMFTEFCWKVTRGTFCEHFQPGRTIK